MDVIIEKWGVFSKKKGLFFYKLHAGLGGALNPYILNQHISKWHFSARGAV